MTRAFVFAVVLLPAVTAICLGATALPAPVVLTFDLTPYGGPSTSLALQPNGLPAVACDGSHLRYGWFDGGTWQFGLVTNEQCTGVSLAFLPSGQPAISYISYPGDELKYAQFDGATWQIATAATNAYELGSRALAILPSGNPALIYLDNNQQSVYAWYDSAAWQSTALGYGGLCSPSITTLPSGSPAIAYQGDNGLTYAWLDGDTWHTSEVGVGGAFGVSLAILPSGQPALAYDGGDYWNPWLLCFAWCTGEQWVTETVAPGGLACSLAIGPDGEPAVGHLLPDINTMYYSWHVSGTWQTELVDADAYVVATGLVALSSGKLLLTYTIGDYSSPLGLAAICGSPVSLFTNPTAGSDTWDGLSAEWDGTHGPKANIGAAMGLAWYLDEVVLAPGTYSGPGNRDLSFYGRQITVRGQDPNDPATVAETGIDLAASPTDRHRAFVFSGGEGPEAALRGVTIRNGCGPLTPVVDNPPSYTLPQGGAVFGRSASPTIADCVFQNNEATLGGAVHLDAPDGATSNPTIARCTFEANHVAQINNYYAPSGGALDCWKSTAAITDCQFLGNTAQNTGGEWICISGAIDFWDSAATVARCIFLGNSADPAGIGGAVTTSGLVTINNCVFAGNYASGFQPYWYDGGGGVVVWDGQTSITSCVFSGNSSGLYGGAIWRDAGDLVVRTSTFTANTAAGGLGNAIWATGDLAIVNSIVWNGPDWGDSFQTMYSDVQGGCQGPGCIDVDPLFVDAAGPDGIPGTADDDLHLQPLSPCVNAGDPAYDPGPDAVDIDGEPRLQQCAVDMGADEVSVFVDCNGNGIVDSCEDEFLIAFPLDSNPGWAVEGQWAFGQPTGGGSHNHDPVAGHTGSFVYGYNLNGDYENNLTARYLTTTPIDCTGVSSVELRFWRWLGVQATPYDWATVRASNDGISWTTVWDNYGQLIADTTWVHQVLDISAVADGRAAVYIRWGMGPTDGSTTYPGWNIDDVELHGTRDCNANGILDECESQADCNNNGKLDVCDLFSGFSPDCNGNGVPDECDVASGLSPDCNSNGVPDECDLASGYSTDCNANGVPDECDIAGRQSPDCNANGLPDECDVASGYSLDCNTNGVPDECDVAAGTSDDCNANNIPDECEPDCNDNGIADSCDLASGYSTDCNANGIPDECEPLVDCNGNGIQDMCDLVLGMSRDCNHNDVPDECDVASGASLDCDANGIPDECQPDCNGNGVADPCDIASGVSLDCNGNGVPDECDLGQGTSLDCNGNSVPDECDIIFGGMPDCNSNGAPDDCDLVSGFSLDCNANGVPDECDVVNGTSQDANGNGIPDECEAGCVGDLNCDGLVGFDDINPFVLYLSTFSAWQAAYPGCRPESGDINCDGTYGQWSFDDINPFVQLMTQCSYAGGCPCPGPISCP
jgi:hypothetical protein